MDKRTSAPARVIAAAALVAAFVIAIVVIGTTLGGDSGHRDRSGRVARHAAAKKKVPATYEVQSGDTLVAIAHRTGVALVRIEELNPQVDPQILIAGEELKLRR
jgi:LysM repeat protein